MFNLIKVFSVYYGCTIYIDNPVKCTFLAFHLIFNGLHVLKVVDVILIEYKAGVRNIFFYCVDAAGKEVIKTYYQALFLRFQYLTYKFASCHA